MTYSENDILFHIGPRALEAGLIYQEQRRVSGFENQGDAVIAKVQGNEPKPYQQVIKIARTSAGKAIFASECSCPVGAKCKLGAAAMFEGLARGSASFGGGGARDLMQSPAPRLQPPLPAQSLPPELATWFEDLDQARLRDEDGYPEKQRQRIVYVQRSTD
ncbi:hypothetical protein [uncultured Rhodoblastus sp.]|uniref:SWIM zinc finger family protein n=1 Tax=uncultured Rhodoblastus sp. TaxID=543037 RepID=UPI0025F6E914|nr:hypothetical protein [uncultured Rhodoblastus sp.]